MGKKGAILGVDWIISLAVFLIYLAIFFMYLTPFAAEQPEASNTLLAGLENSLRANATWHVQRVPILIYSNITSFEPIIAPFSLNWKNISLTDNTSFYRQENKLIFRSNVTAGPNIKWVVSSDEQYIQQHALANLDATASDVTIDAQRFKAEFDGLLKSVSYFEKQRVSGFSISMDAGLISRESAAKEYNYTNLAAKYKLSADNLNHTSFVVGGFPRLFNYVTPRQPFEPHNFTVSLTLHNYTHYFIDALFSGPLNLTGKTCKEKSSGYIDFYDSLSGVSFITDEASTISFCIVNGSVGLSLSMPLNKETNYNIIFHKGDYTETLKYASPYSIRTGFIENLTGISISLMNQLNESDYANLKKAWNYPSKRDFSFQLLNGSNEPVINYTHSAPGIVNVFTREFEEVVLDKYGNKLKYKLRIKGW